MATKIDLAPLLTAAELLIERVHYDLSGHNGQGGNGGLLSSETVKAGDKLRLEIYKVRRETNGVQS